MHIPAKAPSNRGFQAVLRQINRGNFIHVEDIEPVRAGTIVLNRVILPLCVKGFKPGNYEPSSLYILYIHP